MFGEHTTGVRVARGASRTKKDTFPALRENELTAPMDLRYFDLARIRYFAGPGRLSIEPSSREKGDHLGRFFHLSLLLPTP
jgi:hypothetical protein